jgi:hypothetical protein
VSSWSLTRVIRRCTVRKNIKFSDAKQTKQVYKYKNIKTKLYNNNAAIWCNKTCRMREDSNKHIVEEIVRQVGHLPELYEDARSEKIYFIKKKCSKA